MDKASRKRVHNKELHDALLEFTRRGYSAVSANLSGATSGLYPETGLFLELATVHGDELRRLSEYEHVIDVLRSDSAIGEHVGALVGTSVTPQAIFPAIEALPIMVLAASLHTLDATYDETLFHEQYSLFEKLIYEDTLTVTATAGLHNLDLQGLEELALSPNFKVTSLRGTDEPSLWQFSNDIRQLTEPWWGKIVSYAVWRMETPKIVTRQGDARPQDGKRTRPTPPTKQFFDLLLTLRLHRIGMVAIPEVTIEAKSFFNVGGRVHYGISQVPTNAGPFKARYVIGPEDVDRLRSLWDAVSCAEFKAESLRVAIRRFGYAYERSRPEDGLIDLITAFEALLLDDNRELSLRLSLAAAGLLGATNAERSAVFKLVRRAYELRSRIVHGDPVDSGEVAKTASLVEIRLRQALRLLLARGVTTQKQLKSMRKVLVDEALFKNDQRS